MRSHKQNDPESYSVKYLQCFSLGKYLFVLGKKANPKAQKTKEKLKPDQKPPLKDYKVDTKRISRHIFVIHGSRESMEKDVIGILQKTDLTPILMHHRIEAPKSIDTKFNEYPNVNFAVIILSGDEFVYPKKGKPAEAKLRARQDIVFEL